MAVELEVGSLTITRACQRLSDPTRPVNTMADPELRSCAHCGALNRTALRHLADEGRCGKCKQPLPALSEPLDVSSSGQFDEIVNNTKVPILVDFWAPWCGPCRMAAPIVKNLANTLAGKHVVLKVNTDDLPELGARYSVRGIPHFAVIERGRVVKAQSGLMDAKAMQRWLTGA